MDQKKILTVFLSEDEFEMLEYLKNRLELDENALITDLIKEKYFVENYLIINKKEVNLGGN